MGAGAVGCYFGGMLARAGASVTLIGRQSHVDAISRDGLEIDCKSFHETIRVTASPDPAAARGASIVLIAVKTLDTETAAHALMPHLEPDAIVISLQNGVDNARKIRSITHRSTVPAVVYVSAEMAGPGRVRHNGRGDLVIGVSRGDPPATGLDEIASLFVNAGVPCRVSAEIDRELWSKLIINCAYNAISALGRARYGRIISHPEAHTVMKLAVEEAVAVARADGIDANSDELVATADSLAKSVPEALSSTAQDVQLGKRTEIDDLNGYVVARGAVLHVPTPINRTLQALVKLLEQSVAAERES
jgi:2-dehydropantoate 2-reductase